METGFLEDLSPKKGQIDPSPLRIRKKALFLISTVFIQSEIMGGWRS